MARCFEEFEGGGVWAGESVVHVVELCFVVCGVVNDEPFISDFIFVIEGDCVIGDLYSNIIIR